MNLPSVPGSGGVELRHLRGPQWLCQCAAIGDLPILIVLDSHCSLVSKSWRDGAKYATNEIEQALLPVAELPNRPPVFGLAAHLAGRSFVLGGASVLF
jgi:hypothetical protein